jgi:hypothetical protein
MFEKIYPQCPPTGAIDYFAGFKRAFCWVGFFSFLAGANWLLYLCLISLGLIDFVEFRQKEEPQILTLITR